MVNATNKTTSTDLNLNAGTNVESELKNCIQQQSIVFENAVRVIEQLEAAASNRTLGNPESVGLLQKSLDQVVGAQQKVAAAHAKFTATRRIMSSELKTILGQHESLLKTLITRIDQLQKLFESVRLELTPQLDVESRRRNMQAAYQKSMKSV